MEIGGLQKLTLLDFPTKTSCIVFTLGCNMRCPFCHNAGLVHKTEKPIPLTEVYDFLEKRKNLLEGVVITGGEPLLQDGLQDFIYKVKELGYCVKLDTNGSFPDRLKNLFDKGLLDYVAMDIKNSPQKYEQTCGLNIDFDLIKKSFSFIIDSKVDYELRTTMVNELHNNQQIEQIGKEFKGARRFFLQKFVPSDNLIGQNLTPPTDQQMKDALDIIKKYIPNSKIR